MTEVIELVKKKKNIKTVTIILFRMFKKLEGKSEHANQIYERYKKRNKSNFQR